MEKEVQSVKPYLSEQTKDFFWIFGLVGILIVGTLIYNKK
jgi:hypothetical protein